MMHITDDRQGLLDELLRYGAESLDISDELDQRLTESYMDLGQWFKRDNEGRYLTNSEVYPQGSRRLGTLTAPVKIGADCDVDLVYRRDLQRTSVTQSDLKESAGEQLERYLDDCCQRRREIPRLQEGCRCWTLHYSGYHLDVLPALPDGDGPETADGRDAIIITDKNLVRWQSSNPKAYAGWFRKRMEGALRERRVALAKAAGVEIEEIPEDTVKTPLQRSVQLLKRHRDITYEGNPDDKPISIIITTLAAQAYNDERNVYRALLGIAGNMQNFVLRKSGTLWVPNPTNPDENFADRWQTFPERATRFFAWLQSVQTDLDEALHQQGLDRVASVLSRAWGPSVGEQAARRYGAHKLAERSSGTLRAARGTATLGAAGIPVPAHTFYGDGGKKA